jgi:hypothetical protein
MHMAEPESMWALGTEDDVEESPFAAQRRTFDLPDCYFLSSTKPETLHLCTARTPVPNAFHL